jgi:hypothetical protein
MFDGGFNTALWGADKLSGKIVQGDGLLTLTLNISSSNIGLNSSQEYKLIDLKFVEGKLMLDPTSKDGTVYMGIAGSEGQSICGIGTSNTKGDQGVYCMSEYFGSPQRVYTMGISPGTWHVLRIEVDPATMRFAYMLDGETIGSYTPRNPEKYQNLSYGPVVHVDSGLSSTPNVIANADYLKIGKSGN